MADDTFKVIEEEALLGSIRTQAGKIRRIADCLDRFADEHDRETDNDLSFLRLVDSTGAVACAGLTQTGEILKLLFQAAEAVEAKKGDGHG